MVQCERDRLGIFAKGPIWASELAHDYKQCNGSLFNFFIALCYVCFQPSTSVPFHVVLQIHSGAKRSKSYHRSYGYGSGGPVRQMKTPPHIWMSTPTLGSPPPQEETDSSHKVRLYLAEGPVRLLSAHVS